MKETPYLVSAAILIASFVLGNFADIYELPASQHGFMEWISWILGIAGIIIFLSAILTLHKRHHRAKR